MAESKYVGFCIYCGGEPISDEHWAPRWLGGEDFLIRASCEICQDRINKEIENPMSRGPFWSARRYLNIRSHSKGKKKDPLPVTIFNNGKESQVKISESDNPALLSLISLPQPSIFSQDVPLAKKGKQRYTISTKVFDETKFRAFAKLHAFERFSLGFIFVEPLCRLLAKIALGAAVMEFGYEEFRPIVRNFILSGGKDEAEYYVGGTDEAGSQAGSDEFLHMINLEWVQIRSVNYLQATIQLFARFEMPRYFVVVGSAPNWSNDEDIASAWNISVERLKSIRTHRYN